MQTSNILPFRDVERASATETSSAIVGVLYEVIKNIEEDPHIEPELKGRFISSIINKPTTQAYNEARASSQRKDRTFEVELVDLYTEEESNMNSDDMLKSYIDKVDRDQADLRQDIRDREEKTSKRLESIEGRMDTRLNRIEDMISKSSDNVELKMEQIRNEMHMSKALVITAAVIQSISRLTSNLTTTGLSNAKKAILATSAGFDSTVANLGIGLSYNGGTGAVHTVQLVSAELVM